MKFKLRAAILLAAFPCLLPLAGCHKKKQKSAPPATMNTSANLKLVARYPIDVREPSDLSLSEDKKSLWTVSDEDGMIYHLDLEGKLLDRFGSGMKDLEAIASVSDSEVAVVSEKSREVMVLDHQGKASKRGFLDMAGESNKGPESLAYNTADSLFYALKEKSPGLLLTLDSTLKEVGRTELTFAKDYSSMSYEPFRGHLWVLSDESDAVYVLDKDFKIQTVFSFEITQPEGIAVDYEAKKMWVVCDETSTLYAFSFADY